MANAADDIAARIRGGIVVNSEKNVPNPFPYTLQVCHYRNTPRIIACREKWQWAMDSLKVIRFKCRLQARLNRRVHLKVTYESLYGWATRLFRSW
jgi:hypothetical protein